MKKLIAILLLLIVTGCTKVEEYSNDFDFILSYGVMNKNVIDTINDRFTKDLVIDGDVTTELILTEEEKREIYLQMKEIKLFHYPSEIEGMNIEPQSGYRFELIVDGKEKSINWRGEFTESKRDKEFENLITMIIEIIKSKESYKALPEPNGYYE